jgi:hypothetical protein
MKQAKHVKIKTPFTDNLFKPWGGINSPTPVNTNKGGKGKK